MTTAQARAPHGRDLLPGWLHRPLCRRYALVVFSQAPVSLPRADELGPLRVHWALGWLPDGGWEPLGAWCQSSSEALPGFVARLVSDLHERGVERVWHVAEAAPGLLREPVAAAFRGSADRAAADRLLALAAAASPRPAPPAPDIAVARVRRSLMQALRRPARFASEPAVLDFVSAALQRTERRMDHGGVMAKVRPRREAGAHPVPPGT